MRIISGTCKGRRLHALEGGDIRPTPDRVREAVFSSLASRLGEFSGIDVLDLYAGTGAMALEALSRGAEQATLVDRGRQAAKTIRANIETCKLADKARFIQADVLKALPTLAGAKQFDLIFVDPPYGKGLVPETLEIIGRLSLLSSSGILCAETARKDPVPELIAGLELLDCRRYGSTSMALFTLHAAESDEQ